MSVQATITCVIFVITILLLVFKPIPIIITGAIIPTALALFGIIKADTAFADFTNSTSIFMICFCIIGSAFFKTGLWIFSVQRSSEFWERMKKDCWQEQVSWPADFLHS